MSGLKKAYISGMGHYVPEKILTNADLEKMVDTNDEWITTRTGIKERHIAADNENSSDLGAKAAKQAIELANITPDDIDLIICNTITPDMVFPATAALIQEKIQANNAGTIDIEAACTGFIYGLSIASQFIETGKYNHVLVISAEVLTRITDWEDRNTCVLFGDGAGAAVVSAAPEGSDSRLIDFYLRGAGKYKDILLMPAGGSAKPATLETVKNREHYIRMDGSSTFKLAVTYMVESVEKVLKDQNMTADQIDWLIPHQANIRIMKMVAKRLKIPEEKVIVNIEKYGNTSAATIPIAFSEFLKNGTIKKGDTVATVAFGGGMTWGANLLKV